MNKKNAWLIAFGLACSFSVHHPAFSADGVYMSSNARSEDQVRQERRELIQSHVQKVVLNTVITKVGEVMRKTIENNQLELFPQIAFQAVQQAAWQVFQQPSTKEFIFELFQQVTDQALAELEEGRDPALVRQHIEQTADEEISTLYQDRVFQHIIEQVLDQALANHRRIIVMHATQQQMKLQLIAQEQEKMKQKIIQEYEKGILRSK